MMPAPDWMRRAARAARSGLLQVRRFVKKLSKNVDFF